MPQSTSQENSAENPNSEDPHNTDVSGSGIVEESDGLGSEAVEQKMTNSTCDFEHKILCLVGVVDMNSTFFCEFISNPSPFTCEFLKPVAMTILHGISQSTDEDT